MSINKCYLNYAFRHISLFLKPLSMSREVWQLNTFIPYKWFNHLLGAVHLLHNAFMGKGV